MKNSFRLNVLQREQTCYEATDFFGIPCQRKSCSQWINHNSGLNCVMLTTQKGPMTLVEIGKIYNLSRMRICQIEKNIFKKIRDVIQA